MNQQKRLIALILALLMAAALFSGCGKSGTPAATEAPKATEAPAPETQAPAEATEPAAEPGNALSGLAAQVFGENAAPEAWSLPLSDGEETLTLAATFPDPLFAACPDGLIDCQIYQKAEELTGVHMEYISLSTSESNAKFPIMINAGELPDIVGWGLNYVGGNDLAIEEGDYLPLNDIVAQYCPNFFSIVSADEELLSSILLGSGNLVNFGTLIVEDTRPEFGPMIRQDLLDQLGMDKPYTLDEYYDVLTAFKTECGVAEPYCLFAPGAAQNDYFVGAYGVAGYLTNFPWSVAPFYAENGQIKFGIVESGFKDYVTLMSQWYQEGLVLPDFISKNSNWNSPDFAAKIAGGNVGIWYSDYGNLGNYNAMSEIEGFLAEGTYDMHLTKDSVNHFSTYFKKSGGNGCIISSNCENVQLAAQWCDFWYTEEGSLLANYGVEGQGFNYNADGKPAYTELVTRPQGFPMRDALLIYASNKTISCVLDNDRLATAYSAEDNAALDIWSEGCDDAYVLPAKVTDFSAFTAEENSQRANLYTDIETLCAENIAKFITGDQPMSEFDAFVQSVWDMKLQEVLDLYQAAYDRVA